MGGFMKIKKSEDYREDLLEIPKDDSTNQNQKLRDLAKEVGSYQPNASGIEFKDKIVNNINSALQTLTIVEDLH